MASPEPIVSTDHIAKTQIWWK